jgi:cyclase
MSLKIIPAIDFLEGKGVRLYQGDFGTKEEVSQDPLATAMVFQEAGAPWIHLVDLDGARRGSMQNRALILDIVRRLSIPAEVGGGVRDLKTIDSLLSQGVARVILGSAAIKNPNLVKEAAKAYPGKIAAGIDAMDEIVRTEGWIEDSKMSYLELADRMASAGVACIIYTDIGKDGALSGPDLDRLAKLKERVKCPVIASGGVRDLSHIRSLMELDLEGAIVGKAIYSGALSLRKALRETQTPRRIIPCLDVYEGQVVKGTQFANLQSLGDPVEFALRYQKQGADELFFLDIGATVEKRDIMADLAARTVRALSIPLTVGGGIRTLEDMKRMFDIGVSRVSVGSAAIRDPGLIRRGAETFGGERLVSSIDVGAGDTPSGLEVLMNSGREKSGMDAVEFAKKMENSGAGSLLVTGLVTDGMKSGYDLKSLGVISAAVDIPVVASGGCGKLEHFYEVFAATEVDGALAASVFHMGELTIRKVKAYLREQGIFVA